MHRRTEKFAVARNNRHRSRLPTASLILTSLALSVLLTNCATQPSPPTRAPVTEAPFEREAAAPGVAPALPSELEQREAPARELINRGRYLDAALLLSELAASTVSPQKENYQLQITSLLLQGNYLLQAEQILNEIDTRQLNLNLQIRKTLLLAQLDLAKQAPQQALEQLALVANKITDADLENQKEFFNKRIDAFTMVGDFAGAAQARSSLNLLIQDPEQILENQEILLRDLQELPDTDLAALREEPYDNIMRGWISLAYIAKTVKDEQQASQMITQWQSEFPNHPVAPSILNTIIAQQPEALGRATQIAILLPTKGRFAGAANAIRDGFLTAYYNQEPMRRPKLRFYDEGADATQINAVYDQAIADGADFVVGPLNKDAVHQLSLTKNFKGGVLTLNYDEDEHVNAPNFFQMSLSPEQEARQVAEHAWLDGNVTAGAIIPDTNWGERVYSAFKERWEELGGKIVEYQTYDAKKSDYSLPIKKLLNIDESETRFAQIRDIAPVKLNFEPRRRKDVDMIFMAAFARQGRLIGPQLRFHRASNIPVYATSHVYNGVVAANADRDMNDVKFSDMPWTLAVPTANTALKNKIERLWPNESKRYMRLYALGVDAFNIVPELNRLRRNRFSSFQGETGLLYLDISNRLLRRLVWAQFVDGEPKVLDKF